MAELKPNLGSTELLRMLPSTITVTPIYGAGKERELPKKRSNKNFNLQSSTAKVGRVLGCIDGDVADVDRSVKSLDILQLNCTIKSKSLSAYSICSRCDKVVKTVELPTHDCKDIEEETTTNNENVPESSGNYIEEARRSNGIYSCHECPLVFTSQANLSQHLESHSKIGCFRCRECQKSFKTYAVLEKHERIHNGTAPYRCTLCPKTFNQPVHLKAHLRRHDGITPYKCTLCPREYADSTSLNYHMTSHTGKRAYNCSLCSKGFAKKFKLQAHLVSHGKDSTQPTGAINPTKQDAKDNTTANFFCRHCTKVFRTSSAMRKHERVHHGPASLRCQTCFQTFPNMSQLKTHQRSDHASTSGSSATKPLDLQFICAQCSQQFGDVLSLNQHKVLVHSR